MNRGVKKKSEQRQQVFTLTLNFLLIPKYVEGVMKKLAWTRLFSQVTRKLIEWQFDAVYLYTGISWPFTIGINKQIIFQDLNSKILYFKSNLEKCFDIILLLIFFAAHSPDNSFLGFAAGNGKTNDSYVKKDIAVIYGKYDYYLQVGFEKNTI